MNYLHTRAKQIKTMILEMAQGNFNYHIPRTAENNETEAIAELLNMLAQELRVSYNPFVFNAPADSIFNVSHYLFLIDPHNNILSTNFDLDAGITLVDQNFVTVLTGASQKTFKKRLKQLLKKPHPSVACRLELRAPNGLFIPLECMLFKLRFNAVAGNFLVVASRIQSLNPLLKEENPLKKEYPVRKLEALKSTQDIHNIQKVEAYLRGHPEDRIASLKALRLRFGLNEYKLKKGFKELYQTSVFKFQMQQRLHKAKHLIKVTTEPLSDIASQTGFKSYVHFGQAFKKEYGMAPSQYRKKYQ